LSSTGLIYNVKEIKECDSASEEPLSDSVSFNPWQAPPPVIG